MNTDEPTWGPDPRQAEPSIYARRRGPRHRPPARLRTVCHRDGTVSYWSVYAQVRIVRATAVPDHELAAMSPAERERVARTLASRIAQPIVVDTVNGVSVVVRGTVRSTHETPMAAAWGLRDTGGLA